MKGTVILEINRESSVCVEYLVTLFQHSKMCSCLEHIQYLSVFRLDNLHAESVS